MSSTQHAFFKLQQEARDGNSAGTIVQLQRALDFDPGSAYRWADLGEAFATAHQEVKARESFERAVTAGPRNPAILVRAANFYFSSGDDAGTMRLFARVLDQPELGEYYTAAFLTYVRMGLPITEVLAMGIPTKRLPVEAFLRFLMYGNDVPNAAATWNWMQERKLSDESMESEYLGFLMRNGQPERAVEIWAAQNTDAAYRKTNWLFNAGFESAPKASPMDWHFDSSKDVQIQRVADGVHDGRGSVRIVIAGQDNVALHSMYQDTVLGPGGWKLRGYLKTAGVTTVEGISLRIYDTAQWQRLDVRTDPLTGSHDWTAVERTFMVARQTELVRVEIVRDPSEKFDNKIAGTVWVDSLELTPVR